MPIRVLIADDHPIVREGLRCLIVQQPDLLWVGEAADGRELITAVQQLAPDVVLLDLRMPNGGGLTALRQGSALSTRWIVLSSYAETDQVLAAVEAGAQGYLIKGSDYSSILDAIRAVARGERVLSPGLVGTLFDTIVRQTEARIARESGLDGVALRMLAAIAEGATTVEIGERLHMSEVTVKRHIQEIVERLGVRNRTQAVAEALRRGWIT
ncbi:MAG: response regulator transcription factor [Chloroflexales bacterium]